MWVAGSEFKGFKMDAVLGNTQIDQESLDLRHHRRRAAKIDSDGGGLGLSRLFETGCDQIFGNVA